MNSYYAITTSVAKIEFEPDINAIPCGSKIYVLDDTISNERAVVRYNGYTKIISKNTFEKCKEN